MASGEIIAIVANLTPTQTAPARGTAIANGSTPVGYHDVIAFSGSTQEYLDLDGFIDPNYTGNGITVKAIVVANTTSNASMMAAGWRWHNTATATIEVLTAAHSFTFKDANAAISWGTSAYKEFEITWSFSNSQIDGLTAAEPNFTFRITRDPAHASDTYTGDCFLRIPSLRFYET